MKDVVFIAVLLALVYLIVDEWTEPKHQLEVVSQNEGTCRNCGAQTIVTIRERKGDD